jgi:predicted glycosyltransferase
MRVLIDIGHPGHVHLFRPFAREMIKKGHKILFTCREKEFEIELLQSAGFDYISFGKKFSTKAGKIFGMFKFDLQEIRVARKFKPDIFLSHGSIYAAHAAFFLGKPHISMEDTGNMEQVRLYLPFTKVVLTPDSFHVNLGKKQISYKGYHELAYLHPNRFIKDDSVKESLNLKVNDSFVLLRFISWNASHDVGQQGLTLEQKLKIVEYLKENNIRFFISAEGNLPNDLEKYRLSLSPERIHSLMYYAAMLISEGATMASESAVLGTPAIYINSMEAGTVNDQENRGLLFHFRSGNGVLEKVKDLLNIPDLKQQWQKRRDKMLADKIDVSAFLIWFVENYPDSYKIMKENPDYQMNFK